jgi:predicted AlkP superfamily pyrophosphatase or phosphodiesterase
MRRGLARGAAAREDSRSTQDIVPTTGPSMTSRPSLSAGVLRRALVPRALTGGAALVLAACAPQSPPATAAAPGAAAGRPYVVMLSFDGFRHDYAERWRLPALQRMAREGATASALVPTFPTKTFPNHYTLVTGLHAGRHGLVGNEMWDPAFHARFVTANDASTGDARWYGGEPIWVTAERQGVKAAAYFWPGSNAAVGGVRPSYWKPYDITVPDSTRIDGMLAWLRLPPAERPHLVLGYLSIVDDSAHRHGPDAAPTRAAAELADRMLARLRDGIARLPIADSVTVVVVSDHGLARTDSAAYLDDYAELGDTVAVVTALTYAQLFFDGDPAKTERAWTALRRLPHARAWKRADLPARFRLRDNPRAGDVFVLMDPPWVIERSRRARPAGWRPGMGNHGFDNALSDMGGIFFAAGPRIVPGARLGPIDNVNVYPFVAELLRLTPAPGIDGTAAPTRPILRR